MLGSHGSSGAFVTTSPSIVNKQEGMKTISPMTRPLAPSRGKGGLFSSKFLNYFY